MNRSNYFNYVEEKLSLLETRVKNRGRLNILDLNIHSENFFAELYNLLFGYEFVNMNSTKQNIEGIDLIDKKNKLLAQVSSKAEKNKIESSLEKDIFKEYSEYTFIFLPIVGNAKNLKDKTYRNPNNVKFSPKENIKDIKDILDAFMGLEIRKQRDIYKFMVNEFASDIDYVKMDSTLTKLIQILSNEKMEYDASIIETNSFLIDNKIAFNELEEVKGIIDDYKIYSHKLSSKYIEFDSMGVNKSLAVLQKIRFEYQIAKKESKNACDVFLLVIDRVTKYVKECGSLNKISIEELELYVGIIVVDAFLRCKIFDNPEGYEYVIT